MPVYVFRYTGEAQVLVLHVLISVVFSRRRPVRHIFNVDVLPVSPTSGRRAPIPHTLVVISASTADTAQHITLKCTDLIHQCGKTAITQSMSHHHYYGASLRSSVHFILRTSCVTSDLIRADGNRLRLDRPESTNAWSQTPSPPPRPTKHTRNYSSYIAWRHGHCGIMVTARPRPALVLPDDASEEAHS